MRVLLKVHVLALSRAIVGFVALGRNNPVPAEVLEVHGKGVTAAAGLGGMLVTVQPTVPLRAFGCLGYFHLHEGFLRYGDVKLKKCNAEMYTVHMQT